MNQKDNQMAFQKAVGEKYQVLKKEQSKCIDKLGFGRSFFHDIGNSTLMKNFQAHGDEGIDWFLFPSSTQNSTKQHLNIEYKGTNTNNEVDRAVLSRLVSDKDFYKKWEYCVSLYMASQNRLQKPLYTVRLAKVLQSFVGMNIGRNNIDEKKLRILCEKLCKFCLKEQNGKAYIKMVIESNAFHEGIVSDFIKCVHNFSLEEGLSNEERNALSQGTRDLCKATGIELDMVLGQQVVHEGSIRTGNNRGNIPEEPQDLEAKGSSSVLSRLVEWISAGCTAVWGVICRVFTKLAELVGIKTKEPEIFPNIEVLNASHLNGDREGQGGHY